MFKGSEIHKGFEGRARLALSLESAVVLAFFVGTATEQSKHRTSIIHHHHGTLRHAELLAVLLKACSESLLGIGLNGGINSRFNDDRLIIAFHQLRKLAVDPINNILACREVINSHHIARLIQGITGVLHGDVTLFLHCGQNQFGTCCAFIRIVGRVIGRRSL